MRRGRDRVPRCVSLDLGVFLVSQVFVASPHKTQPIVEILLKNQPKLIEFLSNFQKERTDDEQFTDEKNYLIKQIRDLKKVAPWSPTKVPATVTTSFIQFVWQVSFQKVAILGKAMEVPVFPQSVIQGRWNIIIWMKKNQFRIIYSF